MFRRQKQLILRSITLIISLLGLFFIIWSDAISDFYDFNAISWFLYWTHLSDLTAIIWIILAWSALAFRLERLENAVNGQFVKNIIFTFIIVTGLVFTAVAYVPNAIINYGVDGYAVMMVTTTFKHVLIPGAFIFLAIFDGEYSKSNIELSNFKRALISFIVPTLYFVFVILMTTGLNVDAPYPILDFNAADASSWPASAIDKFGIGLLILVNMISSIAVGVLYIVVSTFIGWLAERDHKKNELTTEIVNDILKDDLKEWYKK